MPSAAQDPFTRRNFLLAASAMTLAPGALAQTAPIVTRAFNNVMIAVSDLDRSRAFYEKIFGAALLQGDTAIFRIGAGPHFFGIVQAQPGAEPGFLSYGLTVADFDPQRLSHTLTALGNRAEVTSRDGTPEVWTYDPDNLKIQLQHTGYGHGSGPYGAILPPAPKPGKAPFHLRAISHVTIINSNGARSQAFYEKTLGLKVQVRQGPGVAGFAVGAGPSYITFNTATDNSALKGNINHACFTIDDFDPNKVLGILIDNGMEPIDFGNPALIKPMTCRVRFRQRGSNGGGPTYPLGTAELYFNDPDNIAMQLQDVRYCGGSGRWGEICP